MWGELDAELERAKELLADVLRRLGVRGLSSEDIGLDGLEYPDGSPRYQAMMFIRDSAYPLLDKLLMSLLDYYRRDLSFRFRGILPAVGIVSRGGERMIVGEVLALAYLVREFAERGFVRPAALYVSWFDERRGDTWDMFVQAGKALLSTIYRVPHCLVDSCEAGHDAPSSEYGGGGGRGRVVGIGGLRHRDDVANPDVAVSLAKSLARKVEKDPAIAILISKVVGAVERGTPIDVLVRCIETSLR